MYGTPEQVKGLTGVQPVSLAKGMTEEELNVVLTTWLEQLSVEIDTRLGETVSTADARYKGIEAVILRTIAKLVGYAVQNRTNKVVQVGEFAVRLLNASDVVRDLNQELKPYKKGKATLFLSSEEWITP